MKNWILSLLIPIAMTHSLASNDNFLASEISSRFTLLETKAEVEEIIGELENTHHYAEYYKNIQWYVHEGNLVVDGDLDNNIALIVKGDLTIKGDYVDYNSGIGYLICTGDLRAENVLSWNYFSVGKSLYAAGVVGGHYNDFTFRVYGETFQSRAYYSADRDMDCPKNEFAEIYMHSHSDSDWQAKKPFYEILEAEMSMYYDSDYEELSLKEAQKFISKGKKVHGAPPGWEDAFSAVVNKKVFKQPFSFSKNPEKLNVKRLRFELMQENTPAAFFSAAFENKNLHLDLAHNVNSPASILEKLGDSKEETTRQALASNPSTPLNILLKLGNDDSEEVRASLVFNKKIDENIVKILLDDPSLKVQRALACTQHILKNKEQFFNSKDAKTLQNLASNQSLSKDERKKLLGTGNKKVQQKALEEIEVNYENIKNYIYSDDPVLNTWAIKNAYQLTDQEKITLISNDEILDFLKSPNSEVRHAAFKSLVGGAFMPFSIFASHCSSFIEDSLEIARIRMAQISRDPEILSILAVDSNKIVRMMVAENYASPESLLLKMTQNVFNQKEENNGFGLSDRESFVHFNLMKNPQLPEEAFKYIQKIVPVRHSLEPHTHMPPELFLEYAKHDYPYDPGDQEYEDLHKAIALNGNREKQLSFMAKCKSEQFLDFVAQSAYASLETLDYLLDKYWMNDYVIEKLASNTALGKKGPLAEKIIDKLLSHKESYIPNLVYANPGIPLEIKADTIFNNEEISEELILKYWQIHGEELMSNN